MIITLMNQKRGLNRFSKLSDDGDPKASNNLLKHGAKTPVEPRCHHRIWRSSRRPAIKEGSIVINDDWVKTKHADNRITFILYPIRL